MNNRSAARLQGFILKRLNSSSTEWVKVSPGEFSACSGLSRRQFFYAKRSLELWKNCKVRFRTVTKTRGRGWQILAAATPVVPYKAQVNGRCRRLRVNLRGSRVTECNPIWGISKEMQLSKPRMPVLEPSASMIRLAHHLKRVIEALHWDNCKVDYDPGMAFVYAKDQLLWGFSYEQILDCYSEGLSAMHATATDVGLLVGNPSLRFKASSTVNRARHLVRMSQT